MEKIYELRNKLHQCAEISGQETRTKKMLIDFLRAETSLEIFECGDGFCAAHREAGTDKPAIAIRADYDALATPDGGASHLCGHDGHAAALCMTALMAEGQRFGRDVFFVFQPAEETGAGAECMCQIFDRENIGAIYAAHNLPGFPFSEIFTRPGTFACASRGMTITLKGRATHAAYPENGCSPATAVGKLLCALEEISSPEKYTGMTMCTVIGVSMGEKAFGAAAADAEIWLTLRGEHDTDLTKLRAGVLEKAEQLANEYALGFGFEEQDVFPSTENDPKCAELIMGALGANELEVPMRWSEDFGHFLKRCPGAYFGVGAGVDYPALHTDNYEFPDALLKVMADAFMKLILN